MAELIGTETEKNLLAAFADESQMRVKYEIYSHQAKLEGFDYISEVFKELAVNEQEHAKIWYKWFCDHKISSTQENILDAIKGEHSEWKNSYIAYAKTAREEGFDDVADLFEHIAAVEKDHEMKLQKLFMLVKNRHLEPDKQGNYKWCCSICGCIMEQPEEPKYCPLCHEDDAFFFKRQ